jgi:hypothetical protein
MNKSKIKKLFEKILKEGFVSNQTGEHERVIRNLFIHAGLTESSVKKVQQKGRFKDIPNLKNGEFIFQPCGTQNSPDFIFRCDDENYYVECKSSKGYAPTYNSGLPKPEYIYVFCSDKYNETTIFRGCDVLNETKRKEYKSLIEELNKVVDNHRGHEGWNDNRGFDFYMRPMHTQMGGKKSGCDYFIHAERTMCESRVLEMFE